MIQVTVFFGEGGISSKFSFRKLELKDYQIKSKQIKNKNKIFGDPPSPKCMRVKKG